MLRWMLTSGCLLGSWLVLCICVQTCLLSAYALVPSMELFKLLELCCVEVVEWPPWSAVSPGHGVDGDKYTQLLDAVNLLRDVRRYRPTPAGWQSLRPVLVERFEEDGTCFISAEQKYMRTLARRSGSGKPHLGRSGAARPSCAKGQKNAVVVSKHASAEPGLHMTVSGDHAKEENKHVTMHSKPTVTTDNTEHVVDAGRDGDDVMKDDSASVADDAASDVTIVTSDVDIAEFKLSLDDAVQELEADIANRSPSPDVQHLTLDNSDDKCSSSVQIPSSLLSQTEVDAEDSIKHGANDVELEQNGDMSDVVKSQLHGSQTAENEAEAAKVIGEYNLRSGAPFSRKDYLESETDVNKCVTSQSPTSVNQNVDIDDSSETESLSCKEDIVTFPDKAVDAGCNDTTLTTTVDSGSIQSLSNYTELTSDLSNEAVVTANVFQPPQTSVNSTDESPLKLSKECGHDFQTCANDDKDYLESQTVGSEYATLLSPASVDRNMDIDDSDKMQSLSYKEEVVMSLDEAADAGCNNSVLTVTADSVSEQSLSQCPEVKSDLDDEATETNDEATLSVNASQQQQTSSINSTNESLQKVSQETGQELCVNDGTGIVISKTSETDAADTPITDDLGDGASAEHMGNVSDGEVSNSISSVSESKSEAAITSHLEESAGCEGEEVKTLVSLSTSDTSLPCTVKLSGDSVDVTMPRCFVRLQRMPSSSAGTDAAGPDPLSVGACSELQRKCSVVLQRLSPSSLDLSSLSLTKPSTSTQPCTDEEDRMSVITISSDEGEASADVIELFSSDDKCSNAPEQTSASSCMTSAEYVHETIPERMSATETEAGDSNIDETQLGERSECAGSSDVQDIQSPVTVNENEPQSDKLSGMSERTEVASDPQDVADLVTWHPLNYYSYLAADVMKDINTSPAKELEDDLHLTSVLDCDDLTAADSAVISGHVEDQNTEATESGYSELAYHDDTEGSEVVMTESSSVDLTSSESTTVCSVTKHELVIEDENAMCSGVIESSVVVASDGCSQSCAEEDVAVAAAEEDVVVAAIVNEEAETLCSNIIDTATAEAQDLSSLSAVAGDSSTMLDGEESNTAIDNEDCSTLCSDVSKTDTVKTAERLSVPPSESVTTVSDRCSQLCTEEDVAVAVSVNEEAKTLYDRTTDMAEAEARDGDLSSLSAVAVDSSAMLDSDESSTVIENEDSRTFCSDVSHMDTVKTTDILSAMASEWITTTSDDCRQLCTVEDVAVAASVNEEVKTLCGNIIDMAIAEAQDGDLSSLSAVAVDLPSMLDHEESSTPIYSEDCSALCSDVSKMDTVKTSETLSVLPAESVTTIDSVSVVPEGRVESAGWINSVVSRVATDISIDINGAHTSRTEHLGNDPTADKWTLCDESNDGDDVVVCDPFPIFAECRTHLDSIDNLRQSTKTQNTSEGFGDSDVTDGHIGSYEGEIREDVCALIEQADVPEPADEIYLCSTSASMQSSSEGQSEADYEDDLNTDSKICNAGQSADTVVADIQNTGVAATDLNADLQDNMLSGSNDQPVCSHSATAADSSTCLDPEQLEVDNSAAVVYSDDTRDHSISILADIEADVVRSELCCLLVTHSSQDNETCRMLKGTQEPVAEEQPINTENDSVQPINCEENFGAVKLGDSAHDDPDNCTEDYASSKQHLLPAHCEDTSTSIDGTHKETAAENKKVFFKLDKLSAICKDVHKNVQQSGSESTASEDPYSVPDKPEHERSNERPDRALAASTSSASHTFYCPDCPLKFFSYTAFISHLRTENKGFVSSAASTVTRPCTSLPSAPSPATSRDSLPKSLHKDNASVSMVKSRKRKLSEPQKSDSSTGNVDRSETTALVLTEGSVGSTSSQEAQLDSAEQPRPIPVKSRRSLPTSFALTRRSRKQGSAITATGRVTKPDTSATPTPTPAKSRRSLPESLHKSAVSASAGKSRKQKNSDSSTRSVGKLQMSSPVLFAVLTEGSESSASGLPAKLHTSKPSATSSAKSHRSLPKSRRESNASTSAGRSYSQKKNSDSSAGSKTGKQQCREDVVTASQPVAAKSRRRLPKASSLTGKPQKQLMSALDSADTNVETRRRKQDVGKSLHRVRAKSCCSLPKSDSAAAAAGKSESRKRSASQSARCNTGNKRMKEDTAKFSQTKSRRSLPKSSVCCQDSSTSKPKSRSRRSVPL